MKILHNDADICINPFDKLLTMKLMLVGLLDMRFGEYIVQHQQTVIRHCPVIVLMKDVSSTNLIMHHSRRPLPTHQMSLKSKKLLVDGWTDGHRDI